MRARHCLGTAGGRQRCRQRAAGSHPTSSGRVAQKCLERGVAAALPPSAADVALTPRHALPMGVAGLSALPLLAA